MHVLGSCSFGLIYFITEGVTGQNVFVEHYEVARKPLLSSRKSIHITENEQMLKFDVVFILFLYILFSHCWFVLGNIHLVLL